MRYLVNTIDGTITDVAGAVIVDTDHLTLAQFDSFIAMQDDEFVEFAKTVGVPV